MKEYDALRPCLLVTGSVSYCEECMLNIMPTCIAILLTKSI